MKITDLVQQIKPFVMRWIGETGGGPGPYAPSPHDLASAHHTGSLADSQATQFVKTDGTRPLTGNWSVNAGITIDGVDISAHAADASAHHAPVTVADTATIDLALSGQQVSGVVVLNATASGLETTSGLAIADSIAGTGLAIANKVLSLPTPGTLSVSSANSAAAPHTHAITTSNNPGTTQAILASAPTTGLLTLANLTVTNAPTFSAMTPGSVLFAGAGGVLSQDNSQLFWNNTNKRLGIGTTGPFEKLHVAGGGLFLGPAFYDGTYGRAIKIGWEGDPDVHHSIQTTISQGGASANGMRFYVHGGGANDNQILTLALTGNGNVGIGTTTPRRLADFLSALQPQLRLSYADNSVYADFTVGSGGNLTVAPTGDFIFDPIGNDVLPATGYDLNIGSLQKKYLTLHAAELWVETLVAQNTIATIGGRILVGPTTVLTSDLAAGATTIYVKHNEMAVGDRAYLEANGKVEFISIDAGPYGTGPYSYTVTRNLDGSGSNDWYAGDAVFNTGTTGDGFIDLYSLRSVKSATQYGPAIVGNVRNSATYNDWTEHWAIGNLNGIYGYGTNTYGAAFGKYSTTTSWLAADATNGIRIMRGETQLARWDINGNILVGQVAAGQSNVYITAGAVALRNNTTERIKLNSDGSGFLASNNINWDAAGNTYIAGWTITASDIRNSAGTVVMRSAGNLAFGSTPPPSSSSGTGLFVDSTGLYGLNANARQFYIQTSDGKAYAGGGNVVMDASGINIVPATVFDVARGYRFSTTLWHGIYGAVSSNQELNLRNESAAGFGARTFICAKSPMSGTGNAGIFMRTEDNAGASINVFELYSYKAYLSKDLDVAGGLNVGTASGAGTGDVRGSGSLNFTGTASSIAQPTWSAPTLVNGWMNYGAPYATAGYFKDSLGIVHLKGLIKDGAFGVAIFTLPAGYRPAEREIFAVVSNNSIGRVDVEANGIVSAHVGASWLALSGITFRAA